MRHGVHEVVWREAPFVGINPIINEGRHLWCDRVLSPACQRLGRGWLNNGVLGLRGMVVVVVVVVAVVAVVARWWWWWW